MRFRGARMRHSKLINNDSNEIHSILTAFFRREYAVVEDSDEPLERVLIHRINILEIR